jgi:hypothetical protein
VFEFADKYRGPYSSSLRSAVCPCYCDYSGYQDELLWGAAWLHKASRRREYRDYIRRNEVVLHAGDTINEFGWDNKHAGINVLISKVLYVVGGIFTRSNLAGQFFASGQEGCLSPCVTLLMVQLVVALVCVQEQYIMALPCLALGART